MLTDDDLVICISQSSQELNFYTVNLVSVFSTSLYSVFPKILFPEAQTIIYVDAYNQQYKHKYTKNNSTASQI